MFLKESIKHPAVKKFDEQSIFVDPDIYFENTNTLHIRFSDFVRTITAQKVSIIAGSDRSGKTLLLKKLQSEYIKLGRPAIIISGSDIKNSDIDKVIKNRRIQQFGSSAFPEQKYDVFIDDFDNCTLGDATKESMALRISKNYNSCIISSFSTAPSVLYAAMDDVNPAVFSMGQMDNAKIYKLIENWKRVGLPSDSLVSDSECLATYEQIMYLFSQTEIEKHAYAVVRWVELLTTATGEDIAISSYAAAYDTLINSRLAGRLEVKRFDEFKNFLSVVAYTAFIQDEDGYLPRDKFDQCLEDFSQQYLSDPVELKTTAVALFLRETNFGYQFVEEYIWYFLCARYASKVLYRNSKQDYYNFVDNCTSKIFSKKYANIVIYAAYFSDDNYIIDSLLKTLDQLFAKANDWKLTDKSRGIMLGIIDQDALDAISSQAETRETRASLLSEKVADILEDAEELVARYTLPFLNTEIDDSECIDSIDDANITHDSYMKNVNALFRIHSVIGQILSGRSGTYTAATLLNCIEKMVQASGRFSNLNHAIAAVIVYDKDNSQHEIDKLISGALSIADKYNKVMRLFSYWAVYLSQAGLARYLGQDHSIRALNRLVDAHECGEDNRIDGFLPFNFSSVLSIAKIYHEGKVDKADIDALLQKYGEDSAVIALLKTTIRIYSYYMPMPIQDKQWISEKLRMPIRQLELPRFKASQNKNSVSKKNNVSLLDRKA